jgi:hypothetical protein
MLRAGAVYLQVGSAADRLSAMMDTPRMLIELTDTTRGDLAEPFLSQAPGGVCGALLVE